MRRIYLSIFLLSTASLSFEINLTRIFSLTQFYHFAFLIISLALLGYTTSGTFLILFPKTLTVENRNKYIYIFSTAMGICILFAYFIINNVPFDSFQILIKKANTGILFLHLILISLPFFCCGVLQGYSLTIYPGFSNKIYAASMTGSALGCLIALVIPRYLGGEGLIMLCAGLSGIAGLAGVPEQNISKKPSPLRQTGKLILFAFTIIPAVIVLFLRFSGTPGLFFIELSLSPYKELSYALLNPGSKIIYQEWNAYSRVDIVESESLRSLPGLSIRNSSSIPRQNGLYIDGDNMSPLVLDENDLGFTNYLPNAVAYKLKPEASVLIFEPRGGLEIILAKYFNARSITAVEENDLIIDSNPILRSSDALIIHNETIRSFMRKNKERYDIAIIPIMSTFHPIRSGAFSLGEDYVQTEESYQDILKQINDSGIVLINRWLQDPPSESLRTLSLAISALEKENLNPRENIVAFRGYNTVTFLLKKRSFSLSEIKTIEKFSNEKAFDLIYTPIIREDQTNKYNVLINDQYYILFDELINSSNREKFYEEYDYDIRPPTDDKPFFGNYFRWRQIDQIIHDLGKYWQPFGGAGYLVVLVVLIFAILMACIFIFLPLLYISARNRSIFSKINRRQIIPIILFYFGLLGMGYMFIEIPLIHRFIQYLGHPTYAISIVLLTILLSSGFGGYFNQYLPLKYSLPILCLIIISSIYFIPIMINRTLHFGDIQRYLMTFVLILPIGFFMGIPFPAGILKISQLESSNLIIPWAWGINGAASVISAVLSSLISITSGYSAVMITGIFCYVATAGIIIMAQKMNFPELSR